MNSRSFGELIERAQEHDDFWSASLVIEFTEELSRLMAAKGVKRSELAARIGATPAYITKVLRGNVNLTAATMAKLARALGCEVKVHLAPAGARVRWLDSQSNESPEESPVEQGDRRQKRSAGSSER